MEAKENILLSSFHQQSDIQLLLRKQNFSTHSNWSGREMSFLVALISEQTSYDTEHAFFHFGSSVLAMPLPKSLPKPRQLVRCECWGDTFDAVLALFSSSQTLVCYQHLSSYWSKAQ